MEHTADQAARARLLPERLALLGAIAPPTTPDDGGMFDFLTGAASDASLIYKWLGNRKAAHVMLRIQAKHPDVVPTFNSIDSGPEDLPANGMKFDFRFMAGSGDAQPWIHAMQASRLVIRCFAFVVGPSNAGHVKKVIQDIETLQGPELVAVDIDTLFHPDRSVQPADPNLMTELVADLSHLLNQISKKTCVKKLRLKMPVYAMHDGHFSAAFASMLKSGHVADLRLDIGVFEDFNAVVDCLISAGAQANLKHLGLAKFLEDNDYMRKCRPSQDEMITVLHRLLNPDVGLESLHLKMGSDLPAATALEIFLPNHSIREIRLNPTGLNSIGNCVMQACLKRNGSNPEEVKLSGAKGLVDTIFMVNAPAQNADVSRLIGGFIVDANTNVRNGANSVIRSTKLGAEEAAKTRAQLLKDPQLDFVLLQALKLYLERDQDIGQRLEAGFKVLRRTFSEALKPNVAIPHRAVLDAVLVVLLDEMNKVRQAIIQKLDLGRIQPELPTKIDDLHPAVQIALRSLGPINVQMSFDDGSEPFVSGAEVLFNDLRNLMNEVLTAVPNLAEDEVAFNRFFNQVFPSYVEYFYCHGMAIPHPLEDPSAHVKH